MTYERLSIPDVVLCTPTLHRDNRGYVYESFKEKSFCEFLGYDIHFCQDNVSLSQKNVLRGLHTNTPKYAQSKLISVLEGSIIDVAVDFRDGSPTFKKYVMVELNSKNKHQLFVPRGFLHGFSVLSEEALVMIKVDCYFAQGESIGVAYDDKELNIDWKVVDPILSIADSLLPSLHNVTSPFNYTHNYYLEKIYV